MVYRGGSGTQNTMTPRYPQDCSGKKKGLSTFESLETVLKMADKAQGIETDDLPDTLKAVRNGSGPKDTHVSILPVIESELDDWAKAKNGTKTDHPYSKGVVAAITKKNIKA